MWPIRIIKVERFNGIGSSRRHLGICNRRRVIKHFNDAFWIARNFAIIERSHANGDFNRRHFLQLFFGDPARFLLHKIRGKSLLFSENVIALRHATTCEWKEAWLKQNKRVDDSYHQSKVLWMKMKGKNAARPAPTIVYESSFYIIYPMLCDCVFRFIDVGL